MNTFNRVVLVILLLVGMVLCSFVLVLPMPTLRAIALQADGLADFLSGIRPVALLPIGILLALIVDLIGVLLIILEVRRPAPQSISIAQAAGGRVTLSVASLADQLKTEVGQLPDVLQVKPRVSAKRSGVVVELDAKIAAEAGVPNKAEGIVETVRRVVEQKMGLKLARPPKVNIEAVRRVGTATAAEAPRFTPPPSSGSGGVAGTESSPQ
ncbi:MAG: alkaline shock response membrane anchor protein AmaP [Anaerolineae bacterium]|jgi:hypothetical protein